MLGRGGERGLHGCFTSSQLVRAGLTPSKIKTRVARGELVWVCPYVYVAGNPELISWCREAAALLSIGPGAVLSFRSAAVVWEMTQRRTQLIDVTVARRVRPRQGVRIHRVQALERRDVRTRYGLRVTCPARTVIDFAAGASIDELEEAIAQGLSTRRVSERELQQTLARMPANHPGAAAVRALFERDGGPVLTRSGGERKLRALLRQAGLPQPLTNQVAHGFELDFYWPQHKVAVELDSYPFHSKRRAFERDRRKDQALAALGIRVIRITGYQLKYEPLVVIAGLAQVLIARAA